MEQTNFIYCAVYRNAATYGGGLFYLPANENPEELIKEINKDKDWWKIGDFVGNFWFEDKWLNNLPEGYSQTTNNIKWWTDSWEE